VREYLQLRMDSRSGSVIATKTSLGYLLLSFKTWTPLNLHKSSDFTTFNDNLHFNALTSAIIGPRVVVKSDGSVCAD